VSVVLIAEGFGHHVPKGYIYSAMAFSVVVEMLNIRLRRRSTRQELTATTYAPEPDAGKQH
jgi:predicted tellurium resistance membrane protein TerC